MQENQRIKISYSSLRCAMESRAKYVGRYFSGIRDVEKDYFALGKYFHYKMEEKVSTPHEEIVLQGIEDAEQWTLFIDIASGKIDPLAIIQETLEEEINPDTILAEDAVDNLEFRDHFVLQGRMDLIWSTATGKKFCCDYKFSSATNITEEKRLQIMTYYAMYGEMTFIFFNINKPTSKWITGGRVDAFMESLAELADADELWLVWEYSSKLKATEKKQYMLAQDKTILRAFYMFCVEEEQIKPYTLTVTEVNEEFVKENMPLLDEHLQEVLNIHNEYGDRYPDNRRMRTKSPEIWQDQVESLSSIDELDLDEFFS